MLINSISLNTLFEFKQYIISINNLILSFKCNLREYLKAIWQEKVNQIQREHLIFLLLIYPRLKMPL